jgi:hypothetical protein
MISIAEALFCDVRAERGLHYFRKDLLIKLNPLKMLEKYLIVLIFEQK